MAEQEKPKTQKVTLTNTGPGPFVVTDAHGNYVEIPADPEAKPVQAFQPPKPPAEEAEHPVNQVEVELDEGMLAALKQRQENGSPLHIGAEGKKGKAEAHEAAAEHKPQQTQPHHEEPTRKR